MKEFVAAFEQVCKPVPVVEEGSRPGDVAGAYANADRAPSSCSAGRQTCPSARGSPMPAWGKVRDNIIHY